MHTRISVRSSQESTRALIPDGVRAGGVPATSSAGRFSASAQRAPAPAPRGGGPSSLAPPPAAPRPQSPAAVLAPPRPAVGGRKEGNSGLSGAVIDDASMDASGVTTLFLVFPSTVRLSNAFERTSSTRSFSKWSEHTSSTLPQPYDFVPRRAKLPLKKLQVEVQFMIRA